MKFQDSQLRMRINTKPNSKQKRSQKNDIFVDQSPDYQSPHLLFCNTEKR